MSTHPDFLVLGSGIAALRAALALAERGRVCILTKGEPEQGSTGWEKIMSPFAAARLWGAGVPAAYAVQGALKSAGTEVESASLEKLPKASVHVDGEDVNKLLKLLDALEELDDVQKVHSNLDIDEAALAQAEA